jgi:hypothetical protein
MTLSINFGLPIFLGTKLSVSIVDKRADQLEERLLFGPIGAYSKELPDLS